MNEAHCVSLCCWLRSGSDVQTCCDSAARLQFLCEYLRGEEGREGGVGWGRFGGFGGVGGFSGSGIVRNVAAGRRCVLVWPWIKDASECFCGTVFTFVFEEKKLLSCCWSSAAASMFLKTDSDSSSSSSSSSSSGVHEYK